MEYSDVCSILLFNFENYEWIKDVGDIFNIGDIYLFLVKLYLYVGNVILLLVKELGLFSDVVVYVGGGDNVCGVIGVGVIYDKSVLCSIGILGVVLNVEY